MSPSDSATPANPATIESDVIIVGGGIAGLACAVELCRSGLNVHLLEAGPELGGRARSWSDDVTGDRVDIGPHILLTEYHNMLRLLKDLGTHSHITWQSHRFITLVGEPHPVSIQMHRLPAPFHFAPSLLTLPQVTLRELASNRRLMWRVMRLSDREALALDAVTAESYLREMGVSEHFIDWFWRSASMSIMNVPLERCSAGALLRFFRFMVGKSGYQVGFASIGLGDLFAPDAVDRIRASGGRVDTRCEVRAFTGSGTAVNGVQLTDGTYLKSRACVAAVPPERLYALLPQEWRKQHQYFRHLQDFKPSPYISVYLWFDRKLTQEKFWAKVWAPENLNYDFYDLSNIRPDWAARASVIASNIVYSYRAADLSDEEIVAITAEELAQYIPEARQAQLQHARVHRIPMAIPAPYPGAESLRPSTRTPVSGLYLAGDWTSTGLPASMESAVRSGYLAAECLLEDGGQPRPIAIAPPIAEGLVRLIGGA